MTTFLWILLGGILMSAIALVGSVTLILRESTLQKVLLPLVSFAAGSLIGGALFHMIPASLISMPAMAAFAWVALGFLIFFGLEQFLHWHHCHRSLAECKKPLTYLILIGDGLHNFLGGLSIAGVFLVDIRLGIAAWLAAAAHEVPQELGDFGVLIHGGWKKRTALLFNRNRPLKTILTACRPPGRQCHRETVGGSDGDAGKVDRARREVGTKRAGSSRVCAA